MLETIIVVGVILLILAGAIFKIVKDKRKGVKCIGCPMADSCAKNAKLNMVNKTYLD